MELKCMITAVALSLVQMGMLDADDEQTRSTWLHVFPLLMAHLWRHLNTNDDRRIIATMYHQECMAAAVEFLTSQHGRRLLKTDRLQRCCWSHDREKGSSWADYVWKLVLLLEICTVWNWNFLL